jgi:hypothetical protein
LQEDNQMSIRTLKWEYFNNNAVTRTLTYNNHGWLSKIEDSYMSEELLYHSDGYGNAGTTPVIFHR